MASLYLIIFGAPRILIQDSETALRTHVVRVGPGNGESEHLLCLLNGGDIGNDPDGAICLVNPIANNQVTCAGAPAVQILMPLRLGLELSVDRSGDGTGVLKGGEFGSVLSLLLITA